MSCESNNFLRGESSVMPGGRTHFQKQNNCSKHVYCIYILSLFSVFLQKEPNWYFKKQIKSLWKYVSSTVIFILMKRVWIINCCPYSRIYVYLYTCMHPTNRYTDNLCLEKLLWLVKVDQQNWSIMQCAAPTGDGTAVLFPLREKFHVFICNTFHQDTSN